ncbi:MAG: DUF885 domain-containing protein [Pirellulales bacterium]|nr:DUF885 domain-containing protein [Pirellulales bacterium]
MFRFFIPLSLLIAVTCSVVRADSAADARFARLAERYVDEWPAFSPVGATQLGDHRFDGQLDQVSPEARARVAAFCREMLGELEAIDPNQLGRLDQVDLAMLRHALEGSLWRMESLQEWAWDPLGYTELAGDAVYGLVARDFAPEETRLARVADRLAEFPRLFEQVRATLDPARVPRIHAETAVKQNCGVLTVIEEMVEPRLDSLPAAQRAKLADAIAAARRAVETHQTWLESTLVPAAKGDFRLGRERFDRKLAFALEAPLSREDIGRIARAELDRVRGRMYEIAAGIHKKRHPEADVPTKPSKARQQEIIQACLEIGYEDVPARDEVVAAARKALETATEFVRRKDLVTIPPDPVEVILMPKFKQGVAVAYCDGPGPLDVGQKTFFAVAPLPEEWTDQQVKSFLREYNSRSIHELTIHEAMPGHFVQRAHANRCPGRLRALLGSGVYIEGWAMYTEEMMCQEGYLDGDPLFELGMLKWRLRSIANALLDQGVHVDGMTREEAMRLMVEDTFQEESEAAGKWVRAQLTSAQLSTYFVGYMEHARLRREAEAAWGDRFTLKTYHDRVLSFGAPPVQHVRALLLNEPIPGVKRRTRDRSS